jgi:hypothetical protein
MRLAPALVLALVMGSALADDTAPALTPEDHEQVRLGLDAAEQRLCDHAINVLRPVAEADNFGGFAQSTQREVLSSIVFCAYQLREISVAVPFLEALSRMPGGNPLPQLQQLFWAATTTRDLPLIVATLKRIAAYGPQAVATIPIESLYRAHREMALREDDGGLRFEFLQVLYDIAYQPASPFQTSDMLMVAYARLAADKGRTEVLAPVIKGLTSPYAMVEILMDRRFDAVRKQRRLDPHLELEAAAENQLRRLAALVERHPDSLEGHIDYSRALETVRRYDDALEAIQPIAEKLRQAGGSEAFVDADRYGNWALERYSEALAKLDRDAQADAVHEESTQAPEHRGDNVSQRINYAYSQFARGRFSSALRSVADVNPDNTSEYGNVLLHTLRVCSISMGGIEADYLNSLSYVLENERNYGDQVLRTYLCLDDLDSAARNLVRRLEDPIRRTNALKALQMYADEQEQLDELWSRYGAGSGSLDPGELLDLRFDSLRRREDVLQAVDAVGRIIRIPLDSGKGN